VQISMAWYGMRYVSRRTDTSTGTLFAVPSLLCRKTYNLLHPLLLPSSQSLFLLQSRARTNHLSRSTLVPSHLLANHPELLLDIFSPSDFTISPTTSEQPLHFAACTIYKSPPSQACPHQSSIRPRTLHLKRNPLSASLKSKTRTVLP